MSATIHRLALRPRPRARPRIAPPRGWSDWDRRFLASIARYPLPLSPAQRAALLSIVERAP